MLCFLRLLDHDCDGCVSEEDFCQTMCQGANATMACLMRIDERWHMSALQSERAAAGFAASSRQLAQSTNA